MPKSVKEISKYTREVQIVNEAVVELQTLNRPNVRAYCRDRNINHLRQRVQRALNGAKNKSTREPANKKLSIEQDLALERFIDAIDDVGFGVQKELVSQQADALLAEAYEGDGPPPRVGVNWASRWLAAHTKYCRTKATPIELARKLAQSPEALLEWYNKLNSYRQRLGVTDNNLYNMDETGIRIGVAKSSYVYTKHGRQIIIPTATNRELISLIECVSANGQVIEPMLIIKSKSILEHWAVDLPSNYLINITDSGYSNDCTAIDWIKHFNKFTQEHCQGGTRLLLIDGHGSHLTAEFTKYAESNNIQLFALPPHTTHLLQPLDVGCFQPLKHYHSRTIDWASRSGATDIRKTDFLATLTQIRQQTFTEHTIKSGWKRTGLAPFSPEQVIGPLKVQEAANGAGDVLEEGEAVQRASTPTLSSSSEEGRPDVLDNLSPLSRSRFLCQLLNSIGTPQHKELSTPFQTRRPHHTPGDIGWHTPKTIRTLNIQEKSVAYTLREKLPRDLAEGIITTLKGSSAIARAAAGLEQALHNTRAAEYAREQRRRRNRRVVDAGGGPIYAGDCRKMAAARVANEAAKQEAAVAARLQRLLTKRMNTWKKLRPTIRNFGKKSMKRHATGVTVMRDMSRWTYSTTDPERAQEFQQLYTNSIQYLECRGRFRAVSTIISSSLNAAEVSLMARDTLDPYNQLLHQKGLLIDLYVKQESIVEGSSSQFVVYETQIASNSDDSDDSDGDEGYSSPFDQEMLLEAE